MKPFWQDNQGNPPASHVVDRMRKAAKEEKPADRTGWKPRWHGPSPVGLAMVFALAGVFAAMLAGPLPFIEYLKPLKLGTFYTYLSGTASTATTEALLVFTLVRAGALFLASGLITLLVGIAVRPQGNAVYVLWSAILTVSFIYIWTHN